MLASSNIDHHIKYEIRLPKLCCVLDWGEDRTNIPDSRVGVQLIFPHPEPLNKVEEGK